MSRITAPLLSFGASGAIAKTQVYATWKGRPYVRRYAIPSNPNTTDQQETRNTFAWLNNVWKYMPSGAIGAWQAYGQNNRFTDRNGFIKRNLSDLRTQADLANFLFSPSANGGIAAAGIAATPGAGSLTLTLTAPTLPSGWTIVKAIAACIRQQDPQSGALYVVTSAEDATSPYTGLALTGLTSAQVYVYGGWFQFQKPDTSYAYGEALMGTGTPT
jgi:hypothetical protein